MDEYINREDAMKALDEHRLSHTMSMHGDMEMLIEYRDGVIGAMNVLAFVPTADVVPKSEYDRLEKLFNDMTQEAKGYLNRIYGIRADVAREIFEEIEKTVIKFPAMTNDGYMYFVNFDKFAELKKKYTEGEPNG